MSSQVPQVGELSPDGMFSWDGQQWAALPRGYREPTSWTRPMQLAAAAYLVVSAIESLVSSVLFLDTAAVERSVRAVNVGLSADQVRQAAGLGLAFGWATVLFLSLLMLFLAAGSVAGWRWMFWVVLAWFGLSGLGVFTNLAALGSPATQAMPAGEIVIGLLLSLGSLAMLAWFVVAAVRHGPWAMRRPGPR